jgi:hypothetical protein
LLWLKTDTHFEERIVERDIRREWCERVVANPIEERRQYNGRYRMWGFIVERGKFLRVVLLEDKETYYTATWDRRYKVRP